MIRRCNSLHGQLCVHPAHDELENTATMTVGYSHDSLGGVMVLLDEVRHVLQHMLFLFACAVRRRPSLALAHAHSSSGGVEAQPNLPDQENITTQISMCTVLLLLCLAVLPEWHCMCMWETSVNRACSRQWQDFGITPLHRDSCTLLPYL